MTHNKADFVKIKSEIISKKKVMIKAVYILILAFITFMIIYPLVFIAATSFKSYNEFIKNPFNIVFTHPENYYTAWIDGNFSKYFFNSVFVTGISVIANCFFSAVAAFAIGRLKFKGNSAIMFILLSTMFLTGEITSIPLFLLIVKLNLFNTFWALIFTASLGPVGMGALLGSNHIRALPKELCEAAVIDGAKIRHQFFYIDLPLFRPMLILIAVLSFNGVWSDYMWPLIIIPTNTAHWTLPLGLVKFYTLNNSQFGILCAGLCIITIPIIIFYSFTSKYFIEGVAAGAVKG